MLMSFLLRKEVLILTGLTAAFAAPMVRSGELSLSKVMDWAVNGIGPKPEQKTWTAEQSFGIWAPELSTSPQSSNLVPQPANVASNNVLKFLESIFEVQTVPAGAELSGDRSSPVGASLARADNAALPALGGGTDLSQQPTETSGLTNRPPAASTAASSLVTNRVADANSGVAIPPPGTPFATVPGPNATASNGPGSAANPLSDWIPVLDLREVVRFDVSPYWVQQRWPQSTRLDLDSDGYYGFRVPLVTDQRVGGLSGALTYCFDSQAVVQRIQFQGSAQEIGPLQGLLTQYFKFSPIADRPNLLAPVHEQSARGMLRYSEPIIEVPGQPLRLREVAFEINSTQGRYQLSEPYRRLAIQ